MSFRKKALVLSLSLLSIGIIGTALRGGPTYGIDFAGGIELQAKFHSDVDANHIRRSLQDAGVGDNSVQAFGDEGSNEYLLRMQAPETGDSKDQVGKAIQALTEGFGEDGYEIRRQEFVGPRVGAELRAQGFQAILLAMIGIMIYIAFRFEFSFAIGAIAALLHDVMLVMLTFILTGREFNLPIIAAILTVIGYSLNDTIVVFDRIRENHGRRRAAPLEGVMNKSINQTLSRTVLTSSTTMIVLLSLYIVTAAGSVIHDFAFALIIGVIVGTYSSIYVASPAVLAWSTAQRNARRRK